MRIAAVYIPEGHLPHIFGEGHKEVTINFGGNKIYTLNNGRVVNEVPNQFYLDDIFDAAISLFSCIVGNNASGKTSLLRVMTSSHPFVYVIENSKGEYTLTQTLEKFHRVYYTPYLHHNLLDNVGNNGKELSKLALLKLDNHRDSAQLEDFLETHHSENTKRWIRFNHFYRQIQSAKIHLPVFEDVELSLEHFQPNIHSPNKFNDTSSQLRPAIRLLFRKIQEEQNRKEIAEGKRRDFKKDDSHQWVFPIRFEYNLYEAALGKLVSILEHAGNRYLEEGYIPQDYEAQLGPLTVRQGIEWFLLNSGVHGAGERYPFSKHIILLDLIDYVRSLVDQANSINNSRKIVINESQALQIIELYDSFNNSFINEWFSYDTKPVFKFLPQITVSSGEQQFLNLFSVLYYHAQNIKADVDVDAHSFNSLEYIDQDILLLLDEGDNAFHPQWKKEYVKYLRSIIPMIFDGFNVQIIITSHDPLTLSDIPKNNVVFLEKSPNGTVIGTSSMKRTFGANISDLLKDSFFLEDGQIGSYVAGVIDKTIQKIRSNSLNEQDIAQIERIIHAIDEPIIKFKLAEMLSEATGDNAFEKQLLDDEITRLQAKRREI